MSHIKVNLTRFKNASKKILAQHQEISKLSDMQELLARALGFRNFQEVVKATDEDTNKNVVKYKISPLFKNLSPEKILDVFFTNKDFENHSNSSDDYNTNSTSLWYFRTKISILQIIEVNKVLFDKGMMDFNFESILRLSCNFQYLWEVYSLVKKNKKSSLMPSLTKTDLDSASLKGLEMILGIDRFEFDFISEKWMEVNMLSKILLKDYHYLELVDPKYPLLLQEMLFKTSSVYKDNPTNPLSSNKQIVNKILEENYFK